LSRIDPVGQAGRHDVRAVESPASDQLPPLRARRPGPLDEHADRARRVLWRAFQRGQLTEDQLAQTLDRMDPVATPDELDPFTALDQ
jgi:hypothetical protein